MKNSEVNFHDFRVLLSSCNNVSQIIYMSLESALELTLKTSACVKKVTLESSSALLLKKHINAQCSYM